MSCRASNWLCNVDDHRVQPLRLVRDAEVHHARGSDGRDAEEIGEPLSRPVLGDQLARLQIDGRRAYRLATLRRRLYASGKGRPRAPAAADAGVDEPLAPVTSIRFAGRSKTCRVSVSCAIDSVRAAPQWRRVLASCLTIRSGSATRLSVSPLWPGWPPLVLPDGSRRLVGFFRKPSLDGGFELAELSRPRRRFKSAFSARKATFSKSRDRLLSHEIAQEFLSSLLGLPEVKGLLSAEHFSVDGTMLKAWASMKSLRPGGAWGEGSGNGPGSPAPLERNREADFRNTQALEQNPRLDDRQGCAPVRKGRRPGEPSLLSRPCADGEPQQACGGGAHEPALAQGGQR